MSHTQKLNFITNTVPSLLLRLEAQTKGNWGVLNAQQMVEHLSDSVRMANGKRNEVLITPVENLERVRAFMLSDKSFKENTKNALMSDIPASTLKANMQEAVDELKVELQDFIKAFESSPSKTMMNPFFGELNFEEWTHLLNKHFEHHCRQFNLLQ
jgi:hypothetical protein